MPSLTPTLSRKAGEGVIALTPALSRKAGEGVDTLWYSCRALSHRPPGAADANIGETLVMKLLTSLVAVPLLLALGSAAEAACVYPQAPQSIPNGQSAAKEDMLAAQATIKEYSTAVQETYLPCLAAELNTAVAALDPADPEFTKKKANAEAIHAKKHNAALDELQAVADRWKAERAAFLAKSAK
jgi:hypothetical protein